MTTNNNGNTLIKGINLTPEQKALITFKGATRPEFFKNNSFWFKDGKPSQDQGYYYPVCTSLSDLPY